MERTVRAAVFETFEDAPKWCELTEAAFLAAVDSEQELFVAADDFVLAVDFAEANGRDISGIEGARIDERVVMAEDLGVVVFEGERGHWDQARDAAERWRSEPDLALSGSFETEDDTQATP